MTNKAAHMTLAYKNPHPMWRRFTMLAFLRTVAECTMRPAWTKAYTPAGFIVGSLFVFGLIILPMTGNRVAQGWLGAIACTVMIVVIAVEALRTKALVLGIGGVVAWIGAAIAFWFMPWPGMSLVLSVPLSLLPAICGVLVWRRLGLKAEPTD